MRQRCLTFLVWGCLTWGEVAAAGFSPAGAGTGLFSELEGILPRSRFPLRGLHPSAEAAFAQVTDRRGPAFADLKQISLRVESVSENGHLGVYLESAYAGSRRDVQTSSAPLATSPLDITTLGGGAFLELPVLPWLGLCGEYGYLANKLTVTPPVGVSLVPSRDNRPQGRAGIRLFLSETDVVSYGRITGVGGYLAPLEQEFAWRHLWGRSGSLNLRYQTGPSVKSWEAAFGLGF